MEKRQYLNWESIFIDPLLIIPIFELNKNDNTKSYFYYLSNHCIQRFYACLIMLHTWCDVVVDFIWWQF